MGIFERFYGGYDDEVEPDAEIQDQVFIERALVVIVSDPEFRGHAEYIHSFLREKEFDCVELVSEAGDFLGVIRQFDPDVVIVIAHDRQSGLKKVERILDFSNAVILCAPEIRENDFFLDYQRQCVFCLLKLPPDPIVLKNSILLLLRASHELPDLDPV